MDIHCENRLLVFGYGPLLKLVAINTDVNFWFEERKTFGRQTINFIDQNQRMNIPNNQRVVRDVTWNDQAKNCIGVAMG
jgi:phosphosulfolactate synthase (CoM biosynthesis protein A)